MNKEPLLIDYETQSRVSISDPTYTSSSTTDIICMSWGFRGQKGYLWWAGDPIPEEIIEHVEDGGMIGASNAEFDEEIWSYIGVEDYGFPETKLEQWFCTQAQARVAGLPSSLDNSAKALGLKVRKDRRGTELIKLCCIPPYSDNEQDYIDLGKYCLQDWVVMDKVSRSIPDLNDTQLEDYWTNVQINRRGIKVDVPLARAASEYAEQERGEINAKLQEVTCGDVTACTQHKRVRMWLQDCLEDDGQDDAIKLMVRYKTDKKTKETVKKYSADKNVRANLLAGHADGEFHLADDVIELLQLMDDAGGYAVAKFGKMARRADPEDNRVRKAIRYAGAPATLRFSSIDLQVHNFRRDAFSAEDAEFYREQMLQGKVLVDRDGKEVRVMDTLGRLLRSAIIPEEGHVFVVCDWSAIESRMTAYLAGDEDKLNVFRNGEDPYCYAASGIYGREITKENDPDERQVGKVTDLACGFLGGAGALAAMASSYRIYIDPEKREDIVKSWRAKHPKIVNYGDSLIKAAQRAVLNPGTVQECGEISYTFRKEDGALYALLPSGENFLRYPECRYEMKPAPWDEKKMIPQLTALKASFTPAADAKEWSRHGLWRGLLLENVVQAACAEMLRAVRYHSEMTNMRPIFDVHDEIVLEVPEDEAEDVREDLQEIMETPPQWLPGLPLTAEPEIMRRYGK